MFDITKAAGHPEGIKSLGTQHHSELETLFFSGADNRSCKGVRHLASFLSLLRAAHAQYRSGSLPGSVGDTDATDNVVLVTFIISFMYPSNSECCTFLQCCLNRDGSKSINKPAFSTTRDVTVSQKLACQPCGVVFSSQPIGARVGKHPRLHHSHLTWELMPVTDARGLSIVSSNSQPGSNQRNSHNVELLYFFKVLPSGNWLMTSTC